MDIWDMVEEIPLLYEGASAGLSRQDDGPARHLAMHLIRGESSPRLTWRGLDMRHIPETLRFYVAAQLAIGRPHEEAFNFITGAAVANRQFRLHVTHQILDHETLLEMFERELSMTREQSHLCASFKQQMITQAGGGSLPPLGAFLLTRPEMPYLDDLVKYDYLRIYIQGSDGMFVTIVKGRSLAPFWWSPQRHTAWAMGHNIAIALDALMSCIWRDACVVIDKAFVERQRQIPQARRSKRDKALARKLVLPRIVPHVSWSPEEHREIIKRRAHAVGGHYRQLSEDRRVSEQAIKNAADNFFAAPPDGYTFVIPYTRGRGNKDEALPQAREVVCKGLLTAVTMFSGLEAR